MTSSNTNQHNGLPYEFENTNPNTFLHQVINCDRCKQAVILVEKYGTVTGRKLCYPCYKELLKKN